MVGREVKNLYPRPPHREGSSLLKVEHWSVEDPLNPGEVTITFVPAQHWSRRGVSDTNRR